MTVNDDKKTSPAHVDLSQWGGAFFALLIPHLDLAAKRKKVVDKNDQVGTAGAFEQKITVTSLKSRIS